jgi:uncharacterized membrane protein
MNDAHLHLVINHFPIIVPVVGILILLAGLIIKSEPVIKTAFGVFVLGALMTFPAMYTGDNAEEIAERLPGVTDALIEAHEESAETFAIFNYLIGIVSLVGFLAFFRFKFLVRYMAWVVLVIGFAGLYFGKVTGTTGGEIRHTEIRSDFSLPKDKIHHDD